MWDSKELRLVLCLDSFVEPVIANDLLTVCEFRSGSLRALQCRCWFMSQPKQKECHHAHRVMAEEGAP